MNELAEAINDIIPALSKNKTGIIPKMALYRQLMQKNYFARSQLSQTSFYRMVRENDLLNIETTKKLRQSFCMQFANELWQADTMYGPSIKQADGSWKKTFLIGFFRGFRDRFLVQYLAFNSLEELNDLTHNWIENAYNNQKHKNTCTARRLFGGDW